MWVQSLDGKDPLEEEMATHSSILPWRIPWTEKPGGLQVHGIAESDMTERLSSVQFSSVAQSCPTLCDPMDYSTPGFPVHRQLSELAPTHVHQVNDAIQPSYPLSSPSPPAFNLSQHQGIF